jgi:hypothetical protein
MKEIEESCTVIIRLNAAVVTLVPPTPIVSDVTAANQTTAFTLNVQIPAASTTNASMPTGVTGTVNGYKTIDGVTTAITLSHSTITAAEVTSGFSFNENLPRFSGTSLIYYTFEVTYTLNAKTYSGVKSESFCFPATPAATPSATPTAAETVGVPSTFTGSIKVTLPSGTKMYYDIPPDTLEDAQAYILAHPGSTVVTTPA